MFADQDHDASNDESQVDSTNSMDFSNEDSFGINSNSGISRRIDRNGVVLGVILIAAVAGLWSMRTLRNGSADMTATRSLPDRISVDPIDSQVMQRLSIPDSSGMELHADRDPFQNWRPAAISNESALIEELVDDVVPDREALCADWQEEVDRVAGLLKLKSVLGGGTERALVNIEGVLLALGDTFDIAKTQIEFSIEDTDRRSALLGCYNSELDCWHEVQVTMGTGE